MKPLRHLSTLALFALLLGALPAEANNCTADAVPAATLLLPYFEVDLANAAGANTTFSIQNVGPNGVLTKVELWSDLAVPAGGFMMYLKPRERRTVDLRNVINCVLPATVNPAGTFPSCAGALPPSSAFCATFDWKNTLSGKASTFLGGKCGGRDFNDSIARGYATIDTMNVCTTLSQVTAGFFTSGGTGNASNLNVLAGDFAIANTSTGPAFSAPLVSIEARVADPETSIVGNATFYGRFDAWTAADNREPLGGIYGPRYSTVSRVASTDLIVWRDPKVNQTAFTCGTVPAWFPLGQTSIVRYTDAGAATLVGGTPFPAAAQRVSALPLTGALGGSGWLRLDLNFSPAAAGNNPPEAPGRAQAWVGTLIKQVGKFPISFESVALNNGCTGALGYP
ncbi:MAG TPA: hypothetical protein VN851_26630 [Thermoanaerobaculia bacterium]|nr:hypothetical protein [Thermoanaerobaculia bacterium]